MADRIAIIGAGYAGMAAAVELADAGCACEVFEASATLGGRARAVNAQGMALDNGAHILLGAYRESLRLMRKVGVDVDTALARYRLHLQIPQQFSLTAPYLPAPLHLAWALLAAHGLPWAEKWAALRFLHRLQTAKFRLVQDMSVAKWLAGQGAQAVCKFWAPLCLAALNTDMHEASAQVFANVLRDSLANGRAASDLLLPACDLSQLFPEPAAAWLAKKNVPVHRRHRVRKLLRQNTMWAIDGHGEFKHIILAVSPTQLAPLLEEHSDCTALLAQIAAWRWSAISTVYLAYAQVKPMPYPMLGLAGEPAQWLFDRSALCRQNANATRIFAAVMSGSTAHIDTPVADLVSIVHRQISVATTAVGMPALPLPAAYQVIHEKRATFACTPNMSRPDAAVMPGLWLAGDFVAGLDAYDNYPATIESAVRSGVRTAKLAAFC